MLDIKYIRENPEKVKENNKNRGVKVDVDRFLELDKKRAKLIQEVDALRAEKNKPKGKPTEKELAELKKTKEKEEKLTKELKEIENEWRELWYKIPNLTHPDVLVSDNEEDNPVLEVVEKPQKSGFPQLDHVKLAEKLDLIDFDRAKKITGAKFYFLKNELAIMEFALIQYVLQITQAHGYTPFTTPDMAKRQVLEGLGFSPREESTQIYNIEGTDWSLIGTAEITMGGYHMDDVLKESELPKKYAAVSHCFRTEAGTYSKYSKGIFRVHQFTKVEMFQYTTPEKAEDEHRAMLAIEKEIFSGLKLPFRIVDHSSADIGTPAYRTFDIEGWMPGKPNKNGSLGDWAELTSVSNCTDYQSRGLNIKYTDKNGMKKLVYMLNGTGVAVQRTMIAILENYQQKDGSVKIPEVLQKYMGGIKEIKRS